MVKGIWKKYQSARENFTSLVAEELKAFQKAREVCNEKNSSFNRLFNLYFGSSY